MGTCMQHGCRLRPNASVGTRSDALWKAMQAEALAEAEREPVLRRLLGRVVLDQKSLEAGLTMLLSLRMEDSVLDSGLLFPMLRDVVASSPGVARAMRRDLLAIRERDPATSNWLDPFLNFKGFHALETYRIASVLWSEGRRGLALQFQGRSSQAFGVDIHPAARIGEGVFLDHATGVVVGETAVIGDGVTILHNVTLGGTGNEAGDRHPKVGNNVLLGAGSQLLGNIKIGDNARIGAGSVVLGDVEPNTTVVGVPARPVTPSPVTIPLTLRHANGT